MLQKTRNEQTLKILQRLRQQGAPSSENISLDMTMAPPPGEGEEGLEETPEGMDGVVQDSGMPASPVLNGLAQAKKKLKQRY